MIIKVQAKVSDLGFYTLLADDKEVAELDGYVPDLFPGEHYGDYLILDIEVKTGKILNWKMPSISDLEEDFGVKL